MKFKEAYDKVKALANGQCFSLAYELTEFSSGEHQSDCRVYIQPSENANNGCCETAHTWHEAIAKMEAKLIKVRGERRTVEEIPEIEDTEVKDAKTTTSK